MYVNIDAVMEGDVSRLAALDKQDERFGGFWRLAVVSSTITATTTVAAVASTSASTTPSVSFTPVSRCTTCIP